MHPDDKRHFAEISTVDKEDLRLSLQGMYLRFKSSPISFICIVDVIVHLLNVGDQVCYTRPLQG